MKAKPFIAATVSLVLFIIPVTAHASDNQDNSYGLTTGGTMASIEQNILPTYNQ